MASYGLNLSEFNEVRSTESPIDFGQLGLAYDEETNVMYEGLWDTDMLWMDAAIFEYEVSFEEVLVFMILVCSYCKVC